MTDDPGPGWLIKNIDEWCKQRFVKPADLASLLRMMADTIERELNERQTQSRR